jgi:hypothetical protein
MIVHSVDQRVPHSLCGLLHHTKHNNMAAPSGVLAPTPPAYRRGAPDSVLQLAWRRYKERLAKKPLQTKVGCV